MFEFTVYQKAGNFCKYTCMYLLDRLEWKENDCAPKDPFTYPRLNCNMNFITSE